MPEDEQQIRTLIERWAEAVHSGEISGVLADHADDIVMFDVPPPHDGVRGIDAYRQTWPPFFEWQARGARFEIVSLEITAGDDVAYAQALLRCGSPEELAERPENRLRLTLGLRKERGQWLVAHEHHSFPLGPELTADSIPRAHERIELEPIGAVQSPLNDLATAPKQGDEGAPDAWLVLNPNLVDGLRGIEVGDDLIVLTWLDRASRDALEVHPRGDRSRPPQGVFSTRSPDRPNPIGLHRVEVAEILGRRLRVRGLEALDGTPILDLKPVLSTDIGER